MENKEKEVLLKVRGAKTYFPIKKGLMKKTVGYVKAVDDISLDNISITMAENGEPGEPDMMANIKPVSGEGFYCNNVTNFSFNRVSVRNHFGSAFRVGKSENVEFTACSAQSKDADAEMIVMSCPDIT